MQWNPIVLSLMNKEILMYAVLLLPQFQEDEGRSQLMGTYKTKEDAEARVNQLVESSNGYYRKSSFSILG